MSRVPPGTAPFGRLVTAMVTPFTDDGALDLDGAAVGQTDRALVGELAAHLRMLRQGTGPLEVRIEAEVGTQGPVLRGVPTVFSQVQEACQERMGVRQILDLVLHPVRPAHEDG